MIVKNTILLKDCYFHQVETILALMNVLAYVKYFIDHANNRNKLHIFHTYFDANENLFPSNEGQKV